MMKGRAQAKYTISVAAELTGVHPQTLRDYESKGLLHPSRTAGNTRLYSDADLVVVRRIVALVEAGVNLTGVKRIVKLQDDLEILQGRFDALEHETQTRSRRRRKRG